jgi:pimeloyl-ACP methyl ester carboxylesterase
VEEPFELTARDGTVLRGTVTLPATGGSVPAALLLNGSGPLDRDSNMPRQTLGVASALAAGLAAHGIASLRYDKRGVGESGGDYLTMGFEAETSDAGAALEALRAHPRVDPERIVVVGHSIGADIAVRLAADDRRISGIVLLAGTIRTGEETMEWQSERIAATLRKPFRRPMLWFQRRTRRRLRASRGDVMRVGLQKLPARWFREIMAFDPAVPLREIECPVLAITGESDLQVDAADVWEMVRLVRGPFEGHTPAKLTHVLRTHDGPPSLGSYREQLREPMDAALVEQVASWTADRTGA